MSLNDFKYLNCVLSVVETSILLISHHMRSYLYIPEVCVMMCNVYNVFVLLASTCYRSCWASTTLLLRCHAMPKSWCRTAPQHKRSSHDSNICDMDSLRNRSDSSDWRFELIRFRIGLLEFLFEHVWTTTALTAWFSSWSMRLSLPMKVSDSFEWKNSIIIHVETGSTWVHCGKS